MTSISELTFVTSLPHLHFIAQSQLRHPVPLAKSSGFPSPHPRPVPPQPPWVRSTLRMLTPRLMRFRPRLKASLKASHRLQAHPGLPLPDLRECSVRYAATCLYIVECLTLVGQSCQLGYGLTSCLVSSLNACLRNESVHLVLISTKNKIVTRVLLVHNRIGGFMSMLARPDLARALRFHVDCV